MASGLLLVGYALSFAAPWYAVLAAMFGIWLYGACSVISIAQAFIDFIKAKEDANAGAGKGA